MKFKGEPNLYIKIANKYVQRVTGKKGFYFDVNGEYETDNQLLIKLISQHFPTVTENVVLEKPTPVYQCKKCDYSTDNKGELMAHYRTEHPK